jgi:Skp family chaperone for outer membrane proteins
MNQLKLLILSALLAVSTSAFSADPLPIALVNVDRILKDYKPLNEKLAPLKAEAKEFEAALQVRQAELETVGNQIRQVQPGSPDYQRLQIQAVKIQNDLQRFIATTRNELQTKEATVYLAFFRQLDSEIAKYAKANNLKLVIRQHQTSFEDGQALQDVAKALNRAILYEDGLDITDQILEALRASGPPTTTKT